MGGGGGTSGAVSFPAYIEDVHGHWLNDDGTTTWGIPPGGSSVVTVYDVMMSALGTGGNPFEGHSFTDPATDFAAVQTRWETLNTLVTGLDPQTDLEGYIDAAVAKVDTAGVLNSITASTLNTTGQGSAGTALAAALVAALGETGIDENTEWKALFDSVVAKIAAQVNTVDFAASKSNVLSAISSLVGQVSGSYDEQVDFPTLFNLAVSSVDDADTLDPASVVAAMVEAIGYSMQVVRESVNIAQEVINDTVIQDLVDGFEQRASYNLANAKRRFASGMADVGAVHGSAFLFGMALLEAQNTADVNRFNAELSLTAYNQAVTGYLQTYAQNLSSSVQVRLANKAGREGMLTDIMRSLLQMYVNKTQLDNIAFSLFGQAYGTEVGARADEEQRRVSLINGSLQSITGLWAGRVEFERSLVQYFKDMFEVSVQNELRSAIVNKQSRDAAFLDSTRMMVGMLSNKIGADHAVASLLTENKRIKVVGTHEYEATEIDLDHQFALWDFNIFERGANILSAPSGMAAALPPKGSKVGSAIGGALQGAGVGAAVGSVVPGVGTLIGAGVGAGLGALGGLLG